MSSEPFVHVSRYGVGRVHGADRWPPERVQAVFERYAHRINYGGIDNDSENEEAPGRPKQRAQR